MIKEEKIYLTVGYFLIVATFIYVFSGVFGLNLPRYYPELGVWSLEKLAGPSMGYYGKVGFTFLLALPLSLVFYLFLPLITKTKKPNPVFWRGATVASLLFGMMFFAAEEWYRWGIEKQHQNLELLSFSLVLVLFLLLLKLVLWVENRAA